MYPGRRQPSRTHWKSRRSSTRRSHRPEVGQQRDPVRQPLRRTRAREPTRGLGVCRSGPSSFLMGREDRRQPPAQGQLPDQTGPHRKRRFSAPVYSGAAHRVTDRWGREHPSVPPPVAPSPRQWPGSSACAYDGLPWLESIAISSSSWSSVSRIAGSIPDAMVPSSASFEG